MANEITLPLAIQDSLNDKEAEARAAFAPGTNRERIVYFYGVVGLVLFPLRKLRPAALLAAGALSLMIVCGITTLTHYSLIWARDRALAVDRLIAAGGQPTEEQRAAQ